MSMIRTSTGSTQISGLQDLIFDLPATGNYAVVIANPRNDVIYELRDIPGNNLANGNFKVNKTGNPGDFPAGAYNIIIYDESTKQPMNYITVQYAGAAMVARPPSPPRAGPSTAVVARAPSPPRAGPSTAVVARAPSPPRTTTAVHSSQIPKSCGCSLKKRNLV